MKYTFIIILIYNVNADNFTNYNNFINRQNSFVQFSFSSPLQPHTSIINDSCGISLAYSLPGFFSYYGQLNISYTNTQNDVYFLAIGVTQISAGINKSIYKSKKKIFYFNGTFGTLGDGYLGSAGLSYLVQLKRSNNAEFVFDAFFHHGGSSKPFFLVNTIFSRGLLLAGNYEFKIRNSFGINIGTGISIIQYRYFDDPYGPAYYIYWDWEKRKDNPELCKWDTHIFIPIGISFIFKF